MLIGYEGASVDKCSVGVAFTGVNSSNVYPITVEVTEIEAIQTIISQADENLNTDEETALEITLSDLTSDNLNFPNGCTLTVLLGENYSYGGTNEIIPNENFVGTLYVPVFVNDGISISNTIELIVNKVFGTFNSIAEIMAMLLGFREFNDDVILGKGIYIRTPNNKKTNTKKETSNN